MEEVPVTASRLPLATDPPGMMEEVVVTGQREPDPLSAEGMMREQAKTKQTKDKNIAEIPVPKDITPEKPAPEKKTTSNQSGGIGPLAEFGRIDKKSTYTPPDLLGLAEQTDVEELIRRGILPENFKGSLSAKRAEEMLAKPVSVAEDVTTTSQAQPPQDKAEGIAAVAEQPKPEPKDVPSDTPLIFRDQQNVPWYR